MATAPIRDWRKTTPNAMFKGAPFRVEQEGIGESGRFVAIHVAAKSESHGTEEMGRKPRVFEVVAYIASDEADQQAAAFVEVCSSPGAGWLQLPMTRALFAHCIGCSTANLKSKQGFVAFQLRFLEKGGGGWPAIPLGDRLTRKLVDGLAGTVDRLISTVLPF